MAHHGDKHGMRHDLEYQHPGLDSHRAQEQALAKIAELAPDHRITIEIYPGRGSASSPRPPPRQPRLTCSSPPTSTNYRPNWPSRPGCSTRTQDTTTQPLREITMTGPLTPTTPTAPRANAGPPRSTATGFASYGTSAA